MSELLGKYYDEKTTKLFESVINKLLKKKYQWFDRIIVNKLSYSENQNYLGVDARLFADEDWVKNQWEKFYNSKPMPSGTQDDPILFEELIGGELSKKIQGHFKTVFVFITSEKTPKYMSWSWIEAIPVEMNDKNLQENIRRILREETEPILNDMGEKYYISWDENYGKSFKLVKTPYGAQSGGKWEPNLVSIVTPENTNAWYEWEELSDEKLDMWKENWDNIQKTLGNHKYNQIIRNM